MVLFLEVDDDDDTVLPFLFALNNAKILLNNNFVSFHFRSSSLQSVRLEHSLPHLFSFCLSTQTALMDFSSPQY